jgi:hypothetical protein
MNRSRHKPAAPTAVAWLALLKGREIEGKRLGSMPRYYLYFDVYYLILKINTI